MVLTNLASQFGLAALATRHLGAVCGHLNRPYTKAGNVRKDAFSCNVGCSLVLDTLHLHSLSTVYLRTQKTYGVGIGGHQSMGDSFVCIFQFTRKTRPHLWIVAIILWGL